MPELIQPATDGLYAVIGELVTTGDSQAHDFCLQGNDPSILLRDYLHELLVLFDRDALIATSIQVHSFDDRKLEAGVQIAVVDTDRSVFHHEVKAITYHELNINPIQDGYEATIIVDI